LVALRVAGSRELCTLSLRDALPICRVCVLSYHSVEDRAVKEVFVEFERDCVCPPGLPVCVCGGNRRRLRKVVRRPLVASDAEVRSEEHTSELQSRENLVCRLLLEKK